MATNSNRSVGAVLSTAKRSNWNWASRMGPEGFGHGQAGRESPASRRRHSPLGGWLVGRSPRARPMVGGNAAEPAIGSPGDRLMSFLIDTDICSAHLRSTPSVSNRFLQYIGRLHVSVLTLGELLSWTLRKNSPPRYQQALVTMLSDVVGNIPSLFPLRSVMGRTYGPPRNTGQPSGKIHSKRIKPCAAPSKSSLHAPVYLAC